MALWSVPSQLGLHMGQIPQEGENGKALLWPNSLIFLTFLNLKRFCPLDSKNVFVLALAHLEPELELFEFDYIGDGGDDDL